MRPVDRKSALNPRAQARKPQHRAGHGVTGSSVGRWPFQDCSQCWFSLSMGQQDLFGCRSATHDKGFAFIWDPEQIVLVGLNLLVSLVVFLLFVQEMLLHPEHWVTVPSFGTGPVLL